MMKMIPIMMMQLVLEEVEEEVADYQHIINHLQRKKGKNEMI